MSFNDYWQAQEKQRKVAAAIAALKSGGKAAQTELLKTLPDAPLLVPLADLPEGYHTGDIIKANNVRLQITMIRGKDQKAYLALFTSEENLRRSFAEPHPYVVLNFKNLVKLALNVKVVGVVIDRNGPASAILPARILPSFLTPKARGARESNASNQAPQQSKAQLQAGPIPRLMTQAEIATLHDYLLKQENITQAYLFGLKQKKKSVLTVGLVHRGVAPKQEEIQSMARGLSAIIGTNGVLVLNEGLKTMVERLVGVVRFDLVATKTDDSANVWPPNADPPAQVSPHNQG